MNNINQKLWCSKSIRAPGTISLRQSKKSYPFYRELLNFQNNLLKAESFYSDSKFLNPECALLKKCIYRMKLKFSSNKGFKALQKVLKSFRMYDVVKIYKIIRSINDSINLEDNGDYMEVPACCNVEFLLVRLQTTVKLMERIVEVTKQAADSIYSVMSIGHMWKTLTVCFGIVSRLRTSAIRIFNYTCTFYQEVKSFYNHIKDENYTWIPKSYILPNSLEEWIGNDWIKNENIRSESSLNFSELRTENGDNLCEDDECYIMNDKSILYNTEKQNALNVVESEDTGQIVSRNSKQNNGNTNSKKRRKRKKSKVGNQNQENSSLHFTHKKQKT